MAIIPKYLPRVVGAVFALPSLWQGFKWLLDWGGRIDVFRTWGNAISHHLSNLPPWLNLLLLFAGLFLIWWDLKRSRQLALSPATAQRSGSAISHTNPTFRIGRIGVLDFAKRVEQAGWRIFGTHDLEGVDLLEGLRQAAIDGDIPFWGRQNRYSNRTLIDGEPLTPISAEHWREYQFDWTSVLKDSSNTDTHTYRMHSTENRTAGGYVDVHLDGDAAAAWLQSPAAAAFKGRRARLERERMRN